MLTQLTDTLIIFAILMGMFLPLERLFSIHRQPVFRAQWKTDLAFFLGQYLLWTTPVVVCLVWMRSWLMDLPTEPLQETVSQWPWWTQALTAVFLSDLCIYWGHRLAHEVPFLWRFHKVHHTAIKMDWMAAYREHPLDNLYTRTIENMPLIILGFPVETIAGFIVFRGVWGMFIHSNIAMKLGPLKYVLGSSRLHHWHHAKSETHCNFANLMPIMDCVFGTYYDPGHAPQEYGISEDVPHGYIQQLTRPMTPNGLGARPSTRGETQFDAAKSSMP